MAVVVPVAYWMEWPGVVPRVVWPESAEIESTLSHVACIEHAELIATIELYVIGTNRHFDTLWTTSGPVWMP